jgi:exopolysaccharide biosynthesis polyprenyl glycosylphosphotransferase
VDGLTAYLAWVGFWFYRKWHLEITSNEPYIDEGVFLKPLAYSALWIFLYWTHGLYSGALARSRTKDFIRLLPATFIGVAIISFISFFDDPVNEANTIRRMLVLYLITHFMLAFTTRFLLTTWQKKMIRSGKVGIKTLVIGPIEKCFQLIQTLRSSTAHNGYLFEGIISSNADLSTSTGFTHNVPTVIGSIGDIPYIIRQFEIEEVILAFEEHHDFANFIELIRKLQPYQLRILTLPSAFDYLVGSVKIYNPKGAFLVEIYPKLISPGVAFAKRMIDITASLLAITIGFPIYALFAIAIKMNSKGPIFYRQERIGKNEQPFTIFKFRSMYIDAERFGPALSSDNDPRITSVGRFLRKTRMDELPQFYNILIGDMSLVGPRPERKFYIDQIVQKAPEYLNLLNIKPGLTSLGQVRYGYAENVDQMIERMKIDLLYLQNISISLDIQILAETVVIVLQRKGK